MVVRPPAAHVKYDPEDRLLLALLDEAHSWDSNARRLCWGISGQWRQPHPQVRQQARDEQPATCVESAGLCCGRIRRGWLSVLPKAAACACGGPRARTIRRRCAGMTASPGGSRWTSAPRLAASAGPGAARSAAASNRMDLAEPLVLLPGLLVLGVGRAARFDDLGVMPWILRLRYEKEITFVEPQQDLMLGRILAETRVPPLELVESLQLEEIIAKPRPA